MRQDDGTTAYQLHALLVAHGYSLSIRTVLRCRTSLGWTFRGGSYCQLIRKANKAKRLAWAQQHIGDDCENVVWTDECTVQLQTHRRYCCRKRKEPPRLKPRYISVHQLCMCLASQTLMLRIARGSQRSAVCVRYALNGTRPYAICGNGFTQLQL